MSTQRPHSNTYNFHDWAIGQSERFRHAAGLPLQACRAWRAAQTTAIKHRHMKFHRERDGNHLIITREA